VLLINVMAEIGTRLYSENARHECSLGEKMAGGY
jgi:hypothetical protein